MVRIERCKYEEGNGYGQSSEGDANGYGQMLDGYSHGGGKKGKRKKCVGV
jgi:hypothetical protein